MDEIWGGGAILPGEILLFWPRSFPGGAIKPNREGRETLIGKGTEEGRSACSTEDSGPEKPGNRVEEKTLKTLARTGRDSPVASRGCGKTQTRGRSDVQGESRQSGRGKGQ